MRVRTRKQRVERLMWGDSRRCPVGRHAYVMEQNAWIEDGVTTCQTRWKCWICVHWQTSPPIGTFAHRAREFMREFEARNPEEYARIMAEIVAGKPQGEQP